MVTFYLKLADLLVTLQFKEALKENKERKHLRSSGEIAKKKKAWRKMKGKWRRVEVIRELKTGRLLTDQI